MLPAGAVLIGIALGLAYAYLGPSNLARVVTFGGAGSGGCMIKGNISSSGERIYHVPGQRYYEATVINPARGERWFCSESDARAAGWRRARI